MNQCTHMHKRYDMSLRKAHIMPFMHEGDGQASHVQGGARGLQAASGKPACA
jgi:hypothetical protein